MTDWTHDYYEHSQHTKKPVQFDHVQLEVVNETIDIEEMAHQGHQAVTYNNQRVNMQKDYKYTLVRQVKYQKKIFFNTVSDRNKT